MFLPFGFLLLIPEQLFLILIIACNFFKAISYLEAVKSCKSEIACKNDCAHVEYKYHTIRSNLLDQMGSDGVRDFVGTYSNATTATVRKGRRHRMRLRKQYFTQIKNLEKTKECRLQYQSYLKYQVGDVIQFQCGKQCEDRTVVDIRRYSNLESMFSSETVRACLPHLSESDVQKGVSEYLTFFKSADLHLGVLVFHLSPTSFKPEPKKGFWTSKKKI